MSVCVHVSVCVEVVEKLGAVCVCVCMGACTLCVCGGGGETRYSVGACLCACRHPCVHGCMRLKDCIDVIVDVFEQ